MTGCAGTPSTAPQPPATTPPQTDSGAAPGPEGAPGESEHSSASLDSAPDGSTEPAPDADCDGLAQGTCDAAAGCAWNEAGEFSACFPAEPAKKCAVGDTPKMCGLLDGCEWAGDACTPVA